MDNRKLLLIYFLKDIYALRFAVEKIRRKRGIDDEIIFLIRKELKDQVSKCYPQHQVLCFPQGAVNKWLKTQALFTPTLIRKIKAQGPAKAIFLFHTDFGIAAFLFRCFLWILGIAEIEFIDLSGNSYIIARSELFFDAIKKQFPKAVRYYWMSWLSLKLRLDKSWGRPTSMSIEPTNLCNLQCPICRTATGKLKRPRGTMRFAAFKDTIDQVGYHTNNILLYSSGEPFLNKDIYRMIRYAKGKDIYVSICTNGMSLDAPRLIDSGLDSISFAVGGARQNTHQVYRQGSQLNKVLENMEELISLKKKLQRERPKVILDFVVQKHNEHELEQVLELALKKEVDGIYFIPTIVWNMDQAQQFLPLENQCFVRYDEAALKKGKLRQKSLDKNRCDALWFNSIIQWDGNVSPCCGIELPIAKASSNTLQWDYCSDYYPLGNILNGDSLGVVWNGSRIRNLRKAALRSLQDIPICSLCGGYDIPPLK